MYQALYRKYRPQTFSDVVGQRGVTETLRAQIVSDRLSHAYLFTGTRGTGKTTCAKILAKAVNCLSLQDGNPCNCCAACRAIDSGSCMDVLEIDAASNTGVDNVRVLRDDAIYSPGEVRKRVYIIDEVHMLSIQAFNALLKIIEEPPAHLMFILATTEVHKVPATILSRCQRFSFRRLAAEDIASRLRFVAYEEGIDLEDGAAHLLARLADGALRDGLSLLDQCASAATGAVTEDTVCRTLGLAGLRQTAQILHAIADHDTQRVLSAFSELYLCGKKTAALLDELCALCRDLLMLKTVPNGGVQMLSGVTTDREALALQERFAAGELLRLTELLQQTIAGLRTSVNERVDAELCLLQMCNPTLSLDAQSIGARLSRVEEQLASGIIPKAKRVCAVQEEEEERPPMPDDADDPMRSAPVQTAESEKPAAQPAAFWPELSSLLRESLGVRERGFFAANGPITPYLSGNTLTLAANSDFVLDMVSTPDVTELVRTKASALFGKPISVKFCRDTQIRLGADDPLDALVAFGGAHNDIFTIK